MIIDKELLNKLKDFGLNSYESKLWAALLSRGSSTAGELSDIAGVPRSRSYDVLESLERKGFIIMKLDKPIKYVAVSPSDVLESIKKKASLEAKEKIKQIESLKTSNILTELNLLHNEGINMIEPSEISGSIKGNVNINSHIELMLRKAKNSILMLMSSKTLAQKHSFILDHVKEAKERGVRTKIAIKGKKMKEHAELAKYANLTSLDVDGTLCIIDNKEVLFMLTNQDTHQSYEAAVWLNTSFFASTLSAMIDSNK